MKNSKWNKYDDIILCGLLLVSIVLLLNVRMKLNRYQLNQISSESAFSVNMPSYMLNARALLILSNSSYSIYQDAEQYTVLIHSDPLCQACPSPRLVLHIVNSIVIKVYLVRPISSNMTWNEQQNIILQYENTNINDFVINICDNISIGDLTGLSNPLSILLNNINSNIVRLAKQGL